MALERPIRHDVARELAICLRELVKEFESIRGGEASHSETWRRSVVALSEAERC